MRRSRNLTLWLLSIVVAGAPLRAAAAPALESLATANHALVGHRATIELFSGDVITGARKVLLGSDLTTWKLGRDSREVVTADVKRVVITKRSRVARWSKRGLLVGALLGGVGFGYSSIDGPFAQTTGAGEVAAGAIVGAAVGAGAGALAGDRVVFEAAE